MLNGDIAQCSGRVLASHARGLGFKPQYLHFFFLISNSCSISQIMFTCPNHVYMSCSMVQSTILYSDYVKINFADLFRDLLEAVLVSSSLAVGKVTSNSFLSSPTSKSCTFPESVPRITLSSESQARQR